MRLLTVLNLVFVLPFNYLFAQSVPLPPRTRGTAILRGKVSDTAERKELAFASVLLLRRSDSILVGHCRSDKAGNFNMKDIPSGKYILLITYPRYADYVDELELKDSAVLALPPIGMIMKSKLLETVVVTGRAAAVRIKGDTVEFKADSFHTNEGAKVEDLLKRLPGIQVDHNGKITAQGKTVEKVLVDGEEFFGDDPTLVTRNFRADIVDKVQLYDKKSDQADFTGIDDGKRTKTINLMIKEDKKNGHFGNLNAAGGTDDGTNKYYELLGTYNKFKGRQKLSAYGSLGNTGKTGAAWQARDNFAMALDDAADADLMAGNVASVSSSGGLDDWAGQYGGTGFPVMKTGGLHYGNKSGDDKQNFNADYKVMNLRVADSSSTQSQYIVPDSFYYNNQRQSSIKEVTRQSFNGTYGLKFDSTSSIKLSMNGGVDHKTSSSGTYSEFLARDSSYVNRNTQTKTWGADYHELNSDLLWKKKLGKPGKTISINFRENYNTDNATGYLNSNTSFYTDGIFSRDSLTDQYKTSHLDNLALDGKAIYTAPLSKRTFLGISYGISLARSHSDQMSFDKSPAGKYILLDSLYSNNYLFSDINQRGGISFNYNQKKLRISGGSSAGYSEYAQKDLLADTTLKRHFLNWYPQANFSYFMSSTAYLNFQYTGNTSAPTLSQIQPTHTNENPLNIIIGNPELKPQFQNNFNLSYNNYKMLKMEHFTAGLTGGFTQNSISSDTRLDLSSGRSTTQYINLDGNYNLAADLGYGFKWQQPDINLDASSNVSRSANVSVLNDVRNITHSGSYMLRIAAMKYKQNKYDFMLSPSAMYTDSRSSVNTGLPTQYWTYSLSAHFNIYLPGKFNIEVNDESTLRQKTAVFTDHNNTNLVNATLTKRLLKGDALQIKLTGNDLLHQNIGLSRSVSSNQVSQSTTSIIQRYFMLSVEWSFNKFGGSK